MTPTLSGLGQVRCAACVGGRLSPGSNCESGSWVACCLSPAPNIKPGTEVNMCRYQCLGTGGMCVYSPLYSHYPFGS